MKTFRSRALVFVFLAGCLSSIPARATLVSTTFPIFINSYGDNAHHYCTTQDCVPGWAQFVYDTTVLPQQTVAGSTVYVSTPAKPIIVKLKIGTDSYGCFGNLAITGTVASNSLSFICEVSMQTGSYSITLDLNHYVPLVSQALPEQFPNLTPNQTAFRLSFFDDNSDSYSGQLVPNTYPSGTYPPNYFIGNGLTADFSTDPLNSVLSARATFASPTGSGHTYLTRDVSGPPLPGGFSAGTPSYFYRVASTASFTGSILACLGYTGITLPGPPRLFHYQAGTWTDITVSTDAANKLVCGNISTFGPLALFAMGDVTAPTISPQVLGTLGSNNWYRSAVSVSWNVADPESGIASSTGCTPSNLMSDTNGTALNCSATNGAGLSSSYPLTIKIDQTKPSAAVSVTPPANANGWNNANVTIAFKGTDSGSGIASCTPPVSLSAQGRNLTFSGTCTDYAGNVSGTASATVNIDRTAPAISGMPGAGCRLWPPRKDMITVATLTAADVLSGLVPGSFQVTASAHGASPSDVIVKPNGSGGYVVQLRATDPGREYSIHAVATDKAGNTASITAGCLVRNK